MTPRGGQAKSRAACHPPTKPEISDHGGPGCDPGIHGRSFLGRWCGKFRAPTQRPANSNHGGTRGESKRVGDCQSPTRVISPRVSLALGDAFFRWGFTVPDPDSRRILRSGGGRRADDLMTLMVISTSARRPLPWLQVRPQSLTVRPVSLTRVFPPGKGETLAKFSARIPGV